MAKEKKEKNQINKAEYKIVLLEKLGGTVRTIKYLDAQRFRDDEDHVVYLKSEKDKFLEIFPQQINDFKNYTIEEVNKLIKKYQNQLEEERTEDTQVNDKNVEYELLKLKAKQRSFKFDDKASYLSFDETARPTFFFLREGSNFFPFKWDTDTKTIFVPSDNRKKSASLALRNKQNKYNIKKMLDGLSIIMIIVGFVMAGGGAYLLFKGNGAYDTAFEKYDQSEIAAAHRACLEDISKVSQTIADTAKNVEQISDNVEDKTVKDTIIKGIIPE